jgi:hypothetical protein
MLQDNKTSILTALLIHVDLYRSFALANDSHESTDLRQGIWIRCESIARFYLK